MYRERCRPSYSAAEIESIYQYPWRMQHDWGDHRRRIEVTEKLIESMIVDYYIYSAADLSCGDAYWRDKFPRLKWQLGDFAEGYQYCGPIEQTIDEIEPVDVFFLCETLEHLDDPDEILCRIRYKAKFLVLSTPKSFQWDENPEHYWAWDTDSVQDMLVLAGWSPVQYQEANAWTDSTRVNGYCFQIWGCR